MDATTSVEDGLVYFYPKRLNSFKSCTGFYSECEYFFTILLPFFSQHSASDMPTWSISCASFSMPLSSAS